MQVGKLVCYRNVWISSCNCICFLCEVRIHCHYLRSWEEAFEAKRKEKAQISYVCVCGRQNGHKKDSWITKYHLSPSSH